MMEPVAAIVARLLRQAGLPVPSQAPDDMVGRSSLEQRPKAPSGAFDQVREEFPSR